MNKTKIILFTALLTFFSILSFLRANYLYTTILDDAYIFFRYAENIANGYGIVWNIGEQPVEGYTSFLYLAILITAKLLSFDLELFAIIIGIISSALTLYLTYLIYEKLYAQLLTHTYTNVITVIILALSPAYAYWASAGMETALFSMFLMLTFYFFLKYSNLSREINGSKEIKYSKSYLTGWTISNGILFGFLCMLRFEAILFFLAALYYLMKREKSFIRLSINTNVILFAAGFIIIFGTYFIWRWSYFGYFFPNTYYAKTGGGLQQLTGGFLYIIKALRLFYGFGWILIIIMIFFLRKNLFTENSRFLFAIGVISLVTTILLGGDHFHLGRFILPVLPMLLVFFPPALDKFLAYKTKSFNLKPTYKVLLLIIIFFIILVIKPVYKEALSGFQNILKGEKEIIVVYDSSCDEEIIDWQHGWIIIGNKLKQIADKDDYIAAVPIGAIGYYSKINVIDMVGLVDPVIAHENFSPDAVRKWTPGHTKGDGKYILSRKPKYIQLTDYLTKNPLEKPHERSTQFVSVKEIWESEDFHSGYEFCPIEVIDGWYYNLFKRKNLK
jgi:hypothetical protein